MEETFDAFLRESGRPTADAFAQRYPHAFLYREVLTGEGTRKFSAQEINSKTRRFERLVGRHAAYALMQQGHRDIEKLLNEAVVASEKTLEARLVRVRGNGPSVAIGSGASADVKLPHEGVVDIAVRVEPTADRFDFDILVEGGEVWYDSQRLAPGKRVHLEEGLQLQLGSEAIYQTFSPVGLLRLIVFRHGLERARGASA